MATYTVTVKDANGTEMAGIRIRHLSQCDINGQPCGCNVATNVTGTNGSAALDLQPEPVPRQHEFQCFYQGNAQYARADVWGAGGNAAFII